MDDAVNPVPAQRRWQPANDVERQLANALADGDPDAFVRTLVEAPLYVPGFVARERLLYRDHEGFRHLVVFTSPQELYASAGELVDGWRGTSLVELVRARPDTSWGLAVNPAAPIGVYISPEQLAELPLPDTPPFSPSDETERLMYDALTGADLHTLLDVLIVSQVLVSTRASAEAGSGPPWAIDDLAGIPTVAVFTSARLMTGRFARPGLRVDLVAVLRRWPPAARQLAVNPGTALGVRFPHERIDDLIRYAEALVARTVGRGVDEPRIDEPPPDLGVVADILRGR